jgi:integrase
MDMREGTLLRLLTGATKLKLRVQHPKIQKCMTLAHPYWFFRYRDDEIQADGTISTAQKRKIVGAIKGLPANQSVPDALTKKEAELARDNFFAEQNARTRGPAATLAQEKPPEPGDVLFGKLAELWMRDYVDKIAGGRKLIAASTKSKYHQCYKVFYPRWKDTRLKDIRAKDVLEWLREACTSWHAMCGVRNAMSGVITKAIEWEILPEIFANPIHRVRLPKKWEVWEKRILSPEQTANVLGLLDDPNLLICETCVDTGTRISEVLGLMVKHVDLDKGILSIEQRNWRGDIDVPKTAKSRRLLALGTLTPRYKAWIEGLKLKGPNAWVFPQDEELRQPRWDTGVRKALKEAARACKPQGAPKEDMGFDFPGFGPHSLRRANITWRQDVGGSAIEVSKIAGHSKVDTTLDYTIIGGKRQDTLTRRVQDMRAKAARKSRKVVEMTKPAVA